MNKEFLESAQKIFKQYKALGEKTFEQLSEEKLFVKYNEESNSIAVIIKHLHGNMLSRWTDFLITDGEKEWRKRDAEFGNEVIKKDDLLKLWNDGWNCLLSTLGSLTPEDLSKTVYIRNEAHSALDAINRQLAHYSYHVGQIIFIGKMLTDTNWKSLSIPKNKSKEFNSEKFSKPKN